MKRLALIFVVVVTAGLLITGAVVRGAARAPLRTFDGTFTHPSLQAETTITRDDWGVPHIVAENAHDAYFAYGFAVAQDRLFQLEILRRLGRGELAEILGPSAIGTDKLSRTLLWRKTGERLWAEQDGFSDEFRESVNAYLEGLNFYLESQPLPIEFRILGIEPTAFVPADALSLLGYMAYGFAKGIKSDSLVSIVQQRNPDVDISWLFPGYSHEAPVTVMEGTEPEAPALASGLGDPETPTLAATLRDANIDEMTLAGILNEVNASFDLVGGFRGSNSWVLGPSRTASGEALLANDPHIGFSNPAVWYECHMQFGDFDNYGVHLPLMPFAIIGHNENRAWSMTMFENDDLDLYREAFDPDDPGKVMYKGDWVDAEQWTEIIVVKGGDPVELDITATPHGPIITNLLKGYEGDPISAWWVFHQITPASMQGFFDLNHANTMADMREAASKIMAPGINISYADKDGNIAWWAAGSLPIRAPGVTGRSILDGASGNEDVLGFVDFADNPQLENPPGGVIVTSNNMSTLHPSGPMDIVHGYWEPTDRAGRILDLLKTRETRTVEELKAVQTDDLLRSAPEMVDAMLGYLNANAAFADGADSMAREAVEALDTWDYHHDIDSIGATIFHFWYDALLEAIAMDEVGPEAFPSYLSLANSKNMLKAVLADPDAPLWDDISTPERETPEEIARSTFETALAELQEEVGPTVADWQWGVVHTVTYGHILGNVRPLDTFWNIGPFPAPGTEESVAKMSWADERYAVTAGASMRLLVDYGHYHDPEGVWFILPTGNSGNFMSPHYDDQAQMYLRGDYRPLRLTDEAIQAHAESQVTLGPDV